MMLELSSLKVECPSLHDKIDALEEDLDLKKEQVEVLERAQIHSLEMALAKENTKRVAEEEMKLKQEHQPTTETQHQTVSETLPIKIKVESPWSIRKDLTKKTSNGPVDPRMDQGYMRKYYLRDVSHDADSWGNKPKEEVKIEDYSSDEFITPQTKTRSKVKN